MPERSAKKQDRANERIRKIRRRVCVFGGGVVKRDDRQQRQWWMYCDMSEHLTISQCWISKQKTLRTQASLCISPDMCSQWLTRGVLLTFKTVCTSGSHERKKINKERRGRGKVSSLLDVTFDNSKYNIHSLPDKNSQNQQPRIHNVTATYICLKVKKGASMKFKSYDNNKILLKPFLQFITIF